MNDKKLINEVQEISWHRNGVGGRGFYAVRFISDIDGITPEEGAKWGQEPGEGIKNAKWLAVLTDTPGECYVICIDLLESRGVRFGGNSWRGDRFEPELREAIEAEGDDTSGSFRIGPFCINTNPNVPPLS